MDVTERAPWAMDSLIRSSARLVAATIGPKIATVAIPKIKADKTGAHKIAKPDRPAARIATNSLLRAKPKNSAKAAKTDSSGKI